MAKKNREHIREAKRKQREAQYARYREEVANLGQGSSVSKGSQSQRPKKTQSETRPTNARIKQPWPDQIRRCEVKSGYPGMLSVDRQTNEELSALMNYPLGVKQRPRLEKELPDGSTYVSYFNDTEVMCLCGGHSDSRARSLARIMQYRPLDSSETREAHGICMDLLKVHSENELNAILSLPRLPFACTESSRAFSIMDDVVNGRDFYQISLSIGEGKENMISLRYLKEDRVLYKDVLVLSWRDQSREKVLLTRDGRAMSKSTRSTGWRAIKPRLNLFIEWTRNPGDIEGGVLRFGIETGHCGICGRSLSDPISARRGIGPVCYRDVFN